MTMILDGSAGVTFPNSTVQASAGQVLQVVSATKMYDCHSFLDASSRSEIAKPAHRVSVKFSKDTSDQRIIRFQIPQMECAERRIPVCNRPDARPNGAFGKATRGGLPIFFRFAH